MMDGWTPTEVRQYVMQNGYWFIICASIESAWEVCEKKLMSGELDSLDI